MFINFLKKRWPLFVILLLFVILKNPHLYASFYWDEGWPYASGIYKMYQNGPSLLPGSIDGELSRGHPLLFHFMGALWMKIFGTTFFALHSYTLTIAVLFLIAIYEISLRFFDFKTAIAAVLIIAFQQIYFVQSAFVLLEILVAFLAFISIYFYVSGKLFWTTIALSLLFLTKESGLVLGALLGLDALFIFLKRKEQLKISFLRIMAVSIPFAVIALFFILQKIISGWYVLPLYNNGIEHNWHDYYFKFVMCLKTVFVEDLRYCYLILLFVLCIISAIKNKKIALLTPIISGIVVYLMLSTFTDINKELSLLLFALCNISFLISTYFLNKSFFYNEEKIRKFIMMSIIFSLAFFMFSSLLFIIGRYLFASLIPILLVVAVYYNQLINQISKWLYIPVLLIIGVIEAYNFSISKGIGDSEIGAFNAIAVHEQVVRFLEKNNDYNTKIGAGGYLEVIHLTDSNTKYISQGRIFTDVKWDMSDDTKILIFDNIEVDYRYDGFKNDTHYKMVHRIERGNAWAEIYRKIEY